MLRVAPEDFQHEDYLQHENGYNTKMDIWSLGMTALEPWSCPISRISTYEGEYYLSSLFGCSFQVLQKTLENSFKKKFSKPFRELVGACVVNDPHKRPTAAKLLDFSFFQRACYNAWTDLIKSSEKQRTKNDFLRGEKLEKEIEKPEGEEIENGDDSDTETKAEEEIENGDDSDTETETKAGEEPEDDDNERDDSDTETKAEEELEDDDNERDDPDPDPDPDTNKGRALSEEGGD